MSTTVTPLPIEHLPIEHQREGLNRLSIHTLVDHRTGTRAVLEAPVFRTSPRTRMNLLRYRGVTYDRQSGDIVSSPVPHGYLGTVSAGHPFLFSERGDGLPLPFGPRGWVLSTWQDDGRVEVSACNEVGTTASRWGTSTRSLLGLRPNPAGSTRLWHFGDHVVWLRQEYQPSEVVTRHSGDAELWPDALVEEFFTSSLCTVMLDDAPLPGVPQGSVVLLEAGSPFLIGVAGTPEELAAFMREDHVPHYLVDLHDGKREEDREGESPSSVSLIGDLPRGSVAHRSLGGRSTVVFTERLVDETISYSTEDGSVIASVADGVSHYTGIPGLTGVWVELGAPHVLRWAGGSWTSDSPIDRLLPGGTDDNVQVITSDGSHRLVGIGGTAEATDAPQASSSPILWCPSSDDPASNVSGTVVTRILPERTVDITLTESTRWSVPLVWFDSSWALPIEASDPAPIDLGSLQPDSVRWCHASSRPVVRVGIDYQALAEVRAEDILAELHQAWEAALGVIAAELPKSPIPPFLGGHSFGAALAAVSVLRGMSSPRGVLLRSGAYDRYATPSGFEHDRRTAASDPSLYSMMTILPSTRAHRDIPFLLTCGDSDENSATTPEQSLYLYENLLVADADVTLSVFPGEGHVFSSRQSIVDRRRLEDNWMSERIQSPQQSHHQ